MGKYFLVELEFKRVQSFLFSVPKLKDMIGANTLIGETIRGVCEKKDNKLFFVNNVSSYNTDIDNLPALAIKYGSSFPIKESDLQKMPYFQKLKNAVATNKSKDYFTYKSIYQDDVLEVALNSGIIVRDGGHFQVFFPEELKAQYFLQAAKGLISTKLPGLILEGRIKPYDSNEDKLERIELDDIKNTECVFDLPQFEDCEISGIEPASFYDHNEECYIGEASLAKHNAAKRFYNKQSKDVLGLIGDSFIDEYFSPEMDFSDIGRLSEGHIAVIHADGNDVGASLKKLVETDKDKYIAQWLKTETFFYRIRSGVRSAFLSAINSNKEAASKDKNLYMMPLMLGGDDILIVTPANVSFNFISDLAKAVKENTNDVMEKDGVKQPLTIGCGILICKSSFPFYKAYELSEELASSAKKLKKTAPNCSYVDWDILSESWHAGIEKTRNKQYLTKKNNETLIFSGKPYIISKTSEEDFENNLENLIEASDKLSEVSARSQFKYLYERIPDGRNKLKLLFEELPDMMRANLRKMLPDESYNGYKKLDNNYYITRIGDLIEIMETKRRGSDK